MAQTSVNQFLLETEMTTEQFDQIWAKYDADKNGYVERQELDNLVTDLLSGADGDLRSENVAFYKNEILQMCDVNNDGRLNRTEMLQLFVVKDSSSSSSQVDVQKEEFLGQFRTATGIHSTDFIKIWKKYDTDKNNYIEKEELDNFLKDLMEQESETPNVDKGSFDEYKKGILEFYDSNMDGKLDLHEMLELLPVEENFLAKLKGSKMSISDFNKVFDHYDQNKDQTIDGDEIFGFVKDILENDTKPTFSRIEDYAQSLKELFDVNKDGKFQKDELMNLLL